MPTIISHNAPILQIIQERRDFHSHNNYQVLKIFENMNENDLKNNEPFIGKF